MLGSEQGNAYKFVRTFHGLYRIKEVSETGVLVCPIDRPNGEPIRVALDRVRHCYKQIPSQFWPPRKKSNAGTEPVNDVAAQPPATTVWTDRLRHG